MDGGTNREVIPGTENSTTFLPFHSLLASYSCGRPHAVGSESVIGTHLFSLVLAQCTGRTKNSTRTHGPRRVISESMLRVCGVASGIKICTHSNFTPSGKVSPTFRGAILRLLGRRNVQLIGLVSAEVIMRILEGLSKGSESPHAGHDDAIQATQVRTSSSPKLSHAMSTFLDPRYQPSVGVCCML